MSFTRRRIQLNLSIAFSRRIARSTEGPRSSSYCNVELFDSVTEVVVARERHDFRRLAGKRRDSERRSSARHAASLLSVLPAPRLTSALHLAPCIPFSRQETRKSIQQPRSDERRCTPPRRSMSASTSPLQQRCEPSPPRRFLGTKISQRENSVEDRRRRGKPYVSHQLVAPFNCIHYGGCHLFSSSRFSRLIILPNTSRSFRDNLFPIVSFYFNYLFNIPEINFRR